MSGQTLESKTQDYWKVSLCWRRGTGVMLVCDANALLRGIRETTGPQHILSRLTFELSSDIIHNQSDKAAPAVRSNP